MGTKMSLREPFKVAPCHANESFLGLVGGPHGL